MEKQTLEMTTPQIGRMIDLTDQALYRWRNELKKYLDWANGFMSGTPKPELHESVVKGLCCWLENDGACGVFDEYEKHRWMDMVVPHYATKHTGRLWNSGGYHWETTSNEHRMAVRIGFLEYMRAQLVDLQNEKQKELESVATKIADGIKNTEPEYELLPMDAPGNFARWMDGEGRAEFHGNGVHLWEIEKHHCIKTDCLGVFMNDGTVQSFYFISNPRTFGPGWKLRVERKRFFKYCNLYSNGGVGVPYTTTTACVQNRKTAYGVVNGRMLRLEYSHISRAADTMIGEPTIIDDDGNPVVAGPVTYDVHTEF